MSAHLFHWSVYFLFARTETGCIDFRFPGFEPVESPYKRQFQITGHVAHFHPVILTGTVDGHGRRPSVENVVSLHVKFAAAFVAELPFDAGVDFPDCRQVRDSLQRGLFRPNLTVLFREP